MGMDLKLRDLFSRNTQSVNSILSKCNLGFLILCPVVAMLNAAGLMDYSTASIVEICVVIAFFSVISVIVCGRIYDDKVSRVLILTSEEVIVCILCLNPIVNLSMLYLLVPMISVMYMEESIFIKTARNCFFAMLVVELVRFLDAYRRSDADSMGYFYSKGYENLIPIVICYVLFCVLIYLLMGWLISMVRGASLIDQEKATGGEKASLSEADSDEKDTIYNVKGLFLSINQTVQGLIRGMDKTLSVNVDYDLPASLKGKPEQIKVALVNMLSDFLQFTQQGTVTLSVTYEKGIAARKGQKITLVCRILCSEDLTEPLQSGITMGFALAKNVITRMGGIILDKTFGTTVQQTCYTVSIQQEVADEETLMMVKQKNRDEQEALIVVSRKKEQDLLAGKTVRALVVDDSRENRRLVAAILKSFGIMATGAVSGQDALEKVITKGYDFVIIDHMMPGKGGIQTAKEIRQLGEPYFELLPLMVMTANMTEEFREIFTESGFSEIISKPIKEEELRLAISRIYLR